LISLHINDNEISHVPNDISKFLSLKSLLLHSNPIPSLPLSIQSILQNLSELSLDWFTYLQPFVGKILKLSKESPDEIEEYFGKRKDSQVVHRSQNPISKKKNNSFIPGLSRPSHQQLKYFKVLQKLQDLLSECHNIPGKTECSFVEFIFFS